MSVKEGGGGGGGGEEEEEEEEEEDKNFTNLLNSKHFNNYFQN
jgi:hypothetical protein